MITKRLVGPLLTALIKGLMDVSTKAEFLDNGTQWKIVDRVLAQRERFETEERPLVNLLDIVVSELTAARAEHIAGVRGKH